MIVSKDEFYIPAFVLKWSAKVNQLFLVKEFFRPALPKLVKEKALCGNTPAEGFMIELFEQKVSKNK